MDKSCCDNKQAACGGGSCCGNSREVNRAALVLLGILFLIAVPLSLLAQKDKDVTSERDFSDVVLVKLGGQLYDNWPKMTEASLEGSHPLYPSEGKKQGTSSWRCKECHGWDYIGKDGRYATGSHFTGIDGLLTSAGMSPDIIYEKISGGIVGHDFASSLAERQRKALAVFVSEGLIDVSQYLDGESKARGDVENGRKLYTASCAACHGADGNAIDFKPQADGVQGVGWLALDNPQESLHKIRWGHPGSNMPSATADGGLSTQDTVDILSYTQTMN